MNLLKKHTSKRKSFDCKWIMNDACKNEIVMFSFLQPPSFNS